MGFKDAIVSLVGEFVELRRNPEFRSRTELASPVEEVDENRLIRRNRDRRHSLNITVGTSGPSTEHVIRQRTFTEPAPISRNRRHSAVPKLQSQTENRIPSPSNLTTKPDLDNIPNRATDRRSSEPHNLRIPPNFNKDRALLSDSDSDTDELVLRRSLNLRRRRQDLRHSVALSEHTIQEELEAEDQEQSSEPDRFKGRTVISITH